MKKILALVLALTMVLGTFTFAAAAPEDVVGEDCEDAVARLGALGIIAGFPDGTYRPDEPVTRAQFAKIIVSALGVGEAAQYAAGATKFADVPADHWATGYINVAVDVGVINGYPDGTFQPENQVTFAEAIKMIVAALGYTPKAEALGGYPGGYLAVAAEEEITDGVNVVGTLSANRGAVAMMVDNALEVNLMEQVSYGDSPRWEASDTKTLLNTKLGVKEVEGFVTDIARNPKTKLADNKFVLSDDEDKAIGTFEMVIDVNTESLFLKEVKILHKDKKVVWVSVETSEKDIVFDTVANVLDGKFELKVADKEYAVVDDADIWVNYDDEEYAKVGDYGYFIFDGKEIVAANLFRFDPEEVDGDADRGFVTAVADDEIEYISLFDADEQVLELDDYDAIYVYNKDFTAASLDDVDENSVIFYWDNDDDEVSIMVMNEVVEGEVTRLRGDRVTVDGKNYVRSEIGSDILSVVSLDEGDDFELWDESVVYDIMDEEVALYLDMNGNIAALVTDAKATSDSLYGIVTWYYEGRNPSIEVFTSEGEEVEYFFEKNSDATELFGEGKDFADPSETNIVAVKYELNSDGEIAKGKIWAINNGNKTSDGAVGLAVKVQKDADRKYVYKDANTYYIGSSTVLIKALDKDGNDPEELDPEVLAYDKLVDMAFGTDVGDAIIFGEKGKTAKMIVFCNSGFKGTKDDIYFGVVTDKPWKVGKNWFAEMDIFGEGKADYKVGQTQVAKGNLVAFYLDGSDKVVDIVKGTAPVAKTEASIVTGTVYKRDGSYITLEADLDTVYRVADGAVLYKRDPDDGFALDGTIRLTRIKKDDHVILLYDKVEKEVVAGLVDPS